MERGGSHQRFTESTSASFLRQRKCPLNADFCHLLTSLSVVALVPNASSAMALSIAMSLTGRNLWKNA